jgi:hypothetical protein
VYRLPQIWLVSMSLTKFLPADTPYFKVTQRLHAAVFLLEAVLEKTGWWWCFYSKAQTSYSRASNRDQVKVFTEDNEDGWSTLSSAAIQAWESSVIFHFSWVQFNNMGS